LVTSLLEPKLEYTGRLTIVIPEVYTRDLQPYIGPLGRDMPGLDWWIGTLENQELVLYI